MPRRAKGARLYFRKAKGKRKAVYVIRDGQHEFSTGTVDREQAEAALRLYLIRKDQAPRIADPHELTVAQALAMYGEGPAAKAEDPARIGYAIDALDSWWGDLPVQEITEELCGMYVEKRGVAVSTVRRELGCLRAAINYALPSGVARPTIWMPDRPPARDVWLTREQAAKLIRAARRRSETRHLARFILIGLYTGSRKTVILGLKWKPHPAGGHVDLATGMLYRKSSGARVTKKRAPSIRIPPKLLAHLRRWHKTRQSDWIIEFRGCGVACVKNAWRTMKTAAGLPNVTRHTLRHTAITWAMQAGMDMWQATGFFGVSMETLLNDYAHHHPDFQSDAVAAANRAGRRAA
mgnify:CR=1 FL=1